MRNLRFYSPHLTPNETPITTEAEYQAARKEFEAARTRRQNFEGRWGPKLKKLSEEERQKLRAFRHRLPYVLVSRCPFSNTPIWQKIGMFSLQDEYWYVEAGNGRENVWNGSLSPHLFCVDGALNLEGHFPLEAQGSINQKKQLTMAAEVPFIKPRVLNMPDMVAVIHRLTVAGKYTAYPIVYFSPAMPAQQEFCISWAKTQYVDHLRGETGVTFIGERSDAQAYDLRPWLEQKKIFWLLEDGEKIVQGTTSSFPYHNISGRRHPYIVEKGQVHDLPDPVQGEAITRIETFR